MLKSEGSGAQLRGVGARKERASSEENGMCQGPGIGSIQDLKVTVVSGTEGEHHSRSRRRGRRCKAMQGIEARVWIWSSDG